MDVIRVEKTIWVGEFSENAHLAVFGELKDKKLDRIDFALLMIKNDDLVSYVTCRELDSESIYWQYGGCVEKHRNTINGFKAIEAALNWCKKHYKRCAFYVENTNISMLRCALKLGFRVTGIRNFKNTILLEHLLEWDKGDI